MKILYFIIICFIFALPGISPAQEIPNGDGDLLWERSIYPRFVNDAKFHPINGNIIAAVNHEIWEIDPADGHTIRVFEGETGIEFSAWIDISTDGNYIILSNGGGTNLKLYDYNLGKLVKYINMGPWSTVDFFPNSSNILFHQARKLFVYDVQNDKIVRESEYLPSSSAFKMTKLSKDGKFIAIGKVSETSGTEKIFTMELWDAETLTKIRDFGEAGDIVEFRDVQISDDNQYIGFLCSGPRVMYLYDLENSSLIKRNDNCSAFSFTPNTKIIVYSGTNPDDAQTNIMNLPKLDTVYQYIWARSIFKFNSHNEMYAGGSTMKLYSNNWYTVGVNDNPKLIENAIYPNPATDYITISIDSPYIKRGLGGVSAECKIYDVLGVKVMTIETRSNVSLQNIDVSALQPGVYFLRVGDRTMKFIKI